LRKIESFLNNNTPFAIIQYFESLKSTRKEKLKKYELIFINEQNELEFIVLTVKGILFFKQHLDKIKLIIENGYGKVYEYNEFKAYKEKILIK
jgi:hypothetical protein